MNWQEVLEWVRDPRGIFAVTTGISVAVFVGVLVMVNIAVWYNPWSIDLTATGRNEVSDDTQRILGRLQTPVEHAAVRTRGQSRASIRSCARSSGKPCRFASTSSTPIARPIWRASTA